MHRKKSMSKVKEETKMIKKNKIWEIMNQPKDKEIIGVKWVYRIKLNFDGLIQKLKERLVAKGYSQLPRINYNEKICSVRVLKENIYMEQSIGFVVKCNEDKILKLKKLYRIKQYWHRTLTGFGKNRKWIGKKEERREVIAYSQQVWKMYNHMKT